MAKGGKKKKQVLKFTLDCTHPVEDGIMDAANFVSDALLLRAGEPWAPRGAVGSCREPWALRGAVGSCPSVWLVGQPHFLT